MESIIRNFGTNTSFSINASNADYDGLPSCLFAYVPGGVSAETGNCEPGSWNVNVSVAAVNTGADAFDNKGWSTGKIEMLVASSSAFLANVGTFDNDNVIYYANGTSAGTGTATLPVSFCYVCPVKFRVSWTTECGNYDATIYANGTKTGGCL